MAIKTNALSVIIDINNFLISMKFTLLIVTLLLSSAVNTFAQIPTGQLIHLSADFGIVDSLGKVKEWDDIKNPAIKFISPAPSNQPSHSATINGHFAVTFDGVGNYLEGPNIFPINKDYTVCVVTRIANFAATNNIVSGNTHAIYLGGTVFPHFLHANFNSQSISTVRLPSSPSIIIARYNQSNQSASFFINGESSDSAVVGVNTDTAIFLGAYQRGNLMAGDIAEVYIYPRYLSDTERVHLQDSLFKKYAISPPQPPDLTFPVLPQQLQVYPRDNDDSATVTINGMLKALGFDSVYLNVSRNAKPYAKFSTPLKYTSQGAPIYFNPRIHAELSEYSFTIGAKSAEKDSLLRQIDSVICGDVLFVEGQSNSIVGGGDTYSNEFCRTFGSNDSPSKGDTLWTYSSGLGNGGGASVGAFALRIQRNFVEKMKIPTVVISGGVGGTPIESHLPDATNPMNLNTIYGSMLYRTTKSRLADRATSIFWYQGESSTITNYFENFKLLYDSWHLDYPNLKKVYVIQVRPGCNAGTPGEVRDLLRSLSDYYPDVVTHSTMGLPGHDGCHFLLDNFIGYHDLGDQLYALLLRDFYHSTDTVGINSPDIKKAFFTDINHQKIALLFNNGKSNLIIPNDTIISGLHTSIKDYFYIGTDTGLVTQVTTNGDTLFLQLAHSSNARMITYLPEQTYNDTSITYEGPWLTNTRGVGVFSFWEFPISYYLDADLHEAQSSPFTLYPNPTSGRITVSFSVKEYSQIRLSIFDELGRVVIAPIEMTKAPGSYSLDIDTHSFGCSTATVQLSIGGKISLQRFAIVH
jgi:hypothetical protein